MSIHLCCLHVIYLFIFRLFDGLPFHNEYLSVILFSCSTILGFINQEMNIISSGKFSVLSSNIASAPLCLCFLPGTLAKFMSDFLQSFLFQNICSLYCSRFSFLCFILDQGLTNYCLWTKSVSLFPSVNKVLLCMTV